MDFNTLILIIVTLGVIWLFLYGLKRILDAETYKTLTNRIVAYIVKAEADIQGVKKGTERLYDVMDNVILTANKREKKLLKTLNLPTLVTSIFTGIVTPILFKKGL